MTFYQNNHKVAEELTRRCARHEREVTILRSSLNNGPNRPGGRYKIPGRSDTIGVTQLRQMEAVHSAIVATYRDALETLALIDPAKAAQFDQLTTRRHKREHG